MLDILIGYNPPFNTRIMSVSFYYRSFGIIIGFDISPYATNGAGQFNEGIKGLSERIIILNTYFLVHL